MATEQSPFLSSPRITGTQSSPSCCHHSLSKQYKATCITTRAGLFVLYALAITIATGFSFPFYFITTPGYIQTFKAFFLLEQASFILALLMFPLAGLVGEVCCKRFKLLISGLVLIMIGWAIFFSLWVLSVQHPSFYYALFFPVLLVIPGVGVFQANALQLWYGPARLS